MIQVVRENRLLLTCKRDKGFTMDIKPQVWHYGLVAQLWDEFWSANTPELAYFQTQIERYGQPVLDLGCGTGRLLLPLLRTGVDIDGYMVFNNEILLMLQLAGFTDITVQGDFRIAGSLAQQRLSSRSSVCATTSTRRCLPMSLAISATMSPLPSANAGLGWLRSAPG